MKLIEARKIIKEVGLIVATWRDVAKSVGVNQAEKDRMSSAFEHQDLVDAIKL